ncbi:hypothetical protein HYE67_002671 [Fusarium culmorum]|uniref:Mitochondrial carrier protein pet8 n=1 Tax=Fusarium culmorum TaxID=5516 RepID=A0A2T4GWT5_FUSCU|nr:hypothetical protein FCULG_00006917 [Fusarium culmorum]QPC60440.1 hypothetical protein HYE67_002671 [Fusarium culmorum]
MMSARSMMTMRSAQASKMILGRGFFTTSTRLGLKESSTQNPVLTPNAETDVDYEKHKQDSLKKQKEGSGHWKPELASDSEEAVKADRSQTDPQKDIKNLQERTKKAAEETHKAGTSTRDNM